MVYLLAFPIAGLDYQYGRQRRVIGSRKMYKDGSASVARSVLLLLIRYHKQSYLCTAFASLEKADLTHRRNGSQLSRRSRRLI